MKKIALLRHGHAEHGISPDFKRKLKPEGYLEIQSVGLKISLRFGRPDRIISSPAVRARQTAEQYRSQDSEAVPLELNEILYAAELEDLLGLLAGLPEELEQVVLVGHNPSLEELIETLSGNHVQLKPGCCCCLTLDIESWPEIFSPLKVGEMELLSP
jgi:phosphohistidine phosphatase